MTLESAQQDPPGPNAADEPVRPTLSQQRAAGFLDATALLWHRHWGCINCHSNFAYLMARPALGVDNPAYRAVRATAEEMVNTTWPGEGPRWDPEVVMGAAVLGFGDAAAGRLQPVTRALVAAHHAGVPGIPENAATALRALRGLGLTLAAAAKVSGNLKSWWRNSALMLNRALPPKRFDAQGLPRLAT